MTGLKNKIALVTGGTGALGKDVTRALVEGGATVAIAARSLRDIPTAGHGILYRRADVTREEDVLALFKDVESELGNIQILIHLAGGYLPAKEIKNTELDEWDQMMGINLRSAFLCSREFLKRLKSQDYGRIVTIASRYALIPTAEKGPYAISKAGLVMLTRMMAEEHRGTGITVNAIVPGIIRTDANAISMPGADQSAWVDPTDISNFILQLCSEHGRSINGACIPFN